MRLLLCLLFIVVCASYALADDLLKISDEKSFKQLLTRKSVLCTFTQSEKLIETILPRLKNSAKYMTGIGALAWVDCSENDETKKICKGRIAPGKQWATQHIENGKFSSFYTREYKEKSIVNFMRDPKGEPSWDDDPAAKNVVHITDKTIDKLLARKEPTLIMFYAPWCGHCKSLKPHYAAAATKAKQEKLKFHFAALDASATSGKISGSKHNVTGYPTLRYFNKGKYQFDFGGDRTTEGLIAWAKRPSPPPPPPPPETPWTEQEGTKVTHLTTANFDSTINALDNALVMFYAPWCGHCKAAKPAYDEAAKLASDDSSLSSSKLCAIDATEHPDIAKRYGVSGYPTFIFYQKGIKQYNYEGGRSSEEFLSFIRSPSADTKPLPSVGWKNELGNDAKHLTANNFNSELKSVPHAFVFFYAPWCGHCKNFKPIFRSLSKTLSSQGKVVTVAINGDSESSLTTKYQIKGFPTLQYFSYGELIETYNGQRTEDAIISFLERKINADNKDNL